MTAEQDERTLSSREHHEQAVARMRDGDMATARKHLDLGIAHVRQELAANPTDTLRQRASELLTQDGRYWDRLAREAQTPEDARRFRADALGSVQAALAIARESANDSLVVLPSVFLGDLFVRDNNLPGAISAYREALAHPLPENHTPAYTFVMQGKLHKTEYFADEKTKEGADPLVAAEDALSLLENFSGEVNPDDTTRQIWITGGHLDIAEVVAKKHDGENRDKAYAHYKEAVRIIEKNEDTLTHRKADAAKVKEVLVDDLEREFAEAQALRNTGDEEKQRECFAAYTRVAEHARVLEDPIMEGHAIHQSGVAHAIVKEFEQADVAYEQAQALFVKAEDTMLQAAVLRDRGALALKQEQYEHAHQLLQKSKELLKDGPEEHLGMTIIKDAEVYHAEGNENAARTHIADGITTLDRGGDTYFRSHGRTNAARVLIDMGSLDTAEQYLTEAEDILHAVKTEHDEFASDRKRIERLRGEIEERRKA